ncbi:MAG: M36 family metallopeptidase [Ilumatobacter sp.]|uniref:M36 family metallopeptidase n=1 Tax=Ilumatobacter sp. TaxID=1967498 RepID=UPI003298D005
MRCRLCVVGGLLAGMLVMSTGSSAAPGVQAAPPDPVGVALDHLTSQSPSASVTDASDLVVAGVVPTDHNGLTHVYVQQQHQGIDVFGAIANIAVKGDGSVFNDASRLMAVVANDAVPEIAAVDAAESAADILGLEPSSSFDVVDAPIGAARSQTLSDAGISLSPIPARLVFQPVDAKSTRLAWELGIETPDGHDWWQIRIDAATGEELDRNNLTVHDDFGGGSAHDAVLPEPSSTETSETSADLVADGSSYRVYAQPTEAPTFGGRTLVNQPADDTASPFGWHDTNGVAGAEFTVTRGNNVSAYTDTDGDNVADVASQPNGGAGLDFDFPIDLANAPSTYQPAAVTNLFYWTNIAHDFLYAYGFDEAAGNFQVNNYGRGGTGNDALNAEAQDGSGTNNANFSTPADGASPRMQMFNWTSPAPTRDGALDNGVVMHEFGHGLSSRLTGGPSTVACLGNQEQAGEGWSDFVALVSTMRSTDTGPQARGIGTYALGQPITGPGIRTAPYSTDMSINGHTYDTIKTAAVPHGVGEVFGTMLWEMTWALVDRYGFDADLASGSGGNNIAMQLVVDGMKLQPCSPGFVDARDAILAADVAGNAGANTCLIWTAFAKRGLGFSATQGLSSSRTDGTQAFDLPSECLPLVVSKTANVATARAGGEITYTLVAKSNATTNQTGVIVTDAVPSGTTYVAGSAGCGGTQAAGVVTFVVGTLTPGQSRSCSFRVRTNASPFSVAVFTDGFEPDASAWTLSHASGSIDWVIDAVDPHTGTNSVFAGNPASVSDKYLALTTPVSILSTTRLSFWHRHDLESGFDGGVVEISTNNGATWADLGPQMTANGYNGTISGGFSSPIAGRPAFTGSQLVYRRTVVDLSSFAGTNARIRFRGASDSSVSSAGWWVDDVSIGTVVSVTNVANATSATETAVSNSVSTDIIAPSLPAAPTAVTGVPGDRRVAVSWTAPAAAPGASVPSAYAVTASPGGATCATSGATTCTVAGLTNGTAYTFTVVATTAAGPGPASAPSAPVTPKPPPYVAVGPDRAIDTRDGGGDRVAGGATLTVPVGAQYAGRSISVNLTVPGALAPGFATLFACDQDQPGTSSLNYQAGQPIANGVITKVSAQGTVCVFVSQPAHVILDVFGDFPS